MLACHFSSGLGNQMCEYAEMLAYKKMNPNQKVYIEDINYHIKQNAISMWNGYELDRVFGIKEPFLGEFFSNEQWQSIIDEVQESRFWADGGWNCGPVFVEAFKHQGLDMINLCQSRRWADKEQQGKPTVRSLVKTILGRQSVPVRNMYWRIRLIAQKEEEFGIIEDNGNYLCGGFLKYMYKKSGMRFVEQEVRKAFTFKEIDDEKNKMALDLIQSTNSVSVHIRRGDMLGPNSDFYKYGYFKKAIRYILTRVQAPCFFFFGTQSDLEWCQKNKVALFGERMNTCQAYYIDWNTGKNSFRDMQLMSNCKHNIITRTSFGWWGSYLNPNPYKITICPDVLFDTTVTIS